MNLSKDARIVTADGKDIGNLNRFVLDPQTKHVTHIVFEHGMLSPKERVLPIALVDHTTDDKVHLKKLTFDLDDMPQFEEEHYVITNEHVLPDRGAINDDPNVQRYYYYPPIGISPMSAPGYYAEYPTSTYTPPMYGPNAVNPIPVSGADEKAVRKETEENIPDNTVALKEGAKVMSSDARHIGNIDKLFLNPKNEITHMLISKGFLFKEHKVIPINWVKNIYEGEIYLTMSGEYLNTLPDYKGQTPG